MSTRLNLLLDRVKAWPADRQAQAESLLEALDSQVEAGLGLSADQAAEVERRLADRADNLLSVDELRMRLSRHT